MIHLKKQASSISRLLEHNDKYDCGTITAFRKFNNCGYETDNEGNPILSKPCSTDEFGKPVKGESVLLSKKEKQQMNAALAGEIRSLGYCFTKVMGKYPEGGKIVNEDSFFVVDCKNSGNLKKDLIKLGIKYKQDSVLILPKGAMNPTNHIKGYLVGTNKCCNSFPGFKKTYTFKSSKLGDDKNDFVTYINGRPYYLSDTKQQFTSGFTSKSLIYKLHDAKNKYEATVPMNMISKLQQKFFD
jgi:hypothetical protein